MLIFLAISLQVFRRPPLDTATSVGKCRRQLKTCSKINYVRPEQDDDIEDVVLHGGGGVVDDVTGSSRRRGGLRVILTRGHPASSELLLWAVLAGAVGALAGAA